MSSSGFIFQMFIFMFVCLVSLFFSQVAMSMCGWCVVETKRKNSGIWFHFSHAYVYVCLPYQLNLLTRRYVHVRLVCC